MNNMYFVYTRGLQCCSFHMLSTTLQKPPHTKCLTLLRRLLSCRFELFPVSQLINKLVFVVSFVGNNGTFIMGYKAMVMDVEFLYHLAYALTSTLGLFVHELFYSILVGSALSTGLRRSHCLPSNTLMSPAV